jgi:hypothetical protein
MEHSDLSSRKNIKSIFFEGSNCKFWDGDYNDKAKARFNTHPYYKKIWDLANTTDTQQRQFYIERFSGGILSASQFIVDSDRTKSRRMFLSLTSDTTFVNGFRSSLQEINDFFLSAMDTIQKAEPNIVNVKPENVKIMGVGSFSLENPYRMVHLLTNLTEKNSLSQVEKKIEENLNDVINFILIKYILSEPVTIKNTDFHTSILILSYLLPKMFGFDFRISIAERESKSQQSDSYDILFQKDLDNFDIDISKAKFTASQTEREVYRELWEYFVAHQKEFQKYVDAADKKGLANALIGRFASQYKPKSSQGNIFTSPVGKKIGIELLKRESLVQSPDLAKKIELLFPALTSRERKTLTRELFEKRIIVNYVIGQEIYSGLTNQDFEVIDDLIKYNIPEYSSLRLAIEPIFIKMNWEDEKTIQSANSLMNHILSMPVQDIGDGGRILGLSLFNELLSRGILNKDTNMRFSHKYKYFGIPEKHERKGIFLPIQMPIIIPLILVEIGVIFGAIAMFLQLSPSFNFVSYFQNFMNGTLSLFGNPILIIGAIIGVAIIAFFGIKKYFPSNLDLIRRKILKK